MVSFGGLRQRLEVKSTQEADGRNLKLDNDDLRPFPLERRTWGRTTFNLFWLASVTNVATWLSGGSYLSAGLGLWDGVVATFFSQILTAILMAVNGRAGAVYHIGFPAYCRSSWGVYGSYWPAFNRGLMACVWQGVNSVTGAQCIYVMLHAIFPGIARIPNHMPGGSALDSAHMMCFFFFWLTCAAALSMDVKKWGILIHIKVVVFFISSAAMIALTVHKAGGAGYILKSNYSPTVKIAGSQRVWAIVRFTLLSPASCATFISNASDWQRNATHRNDPILGQLLGFPLASFIDNLIAMVVASTSTKVTGTFQWNPVPYLDLILTQNYDAKHRAGCFFIALGFVYSLLYSCVFENLLPAANDLSSLLPRYLNIKRGFWVCMIMTWVLNPWFLLSSGAVFLTFISSYQIFLFSIIGVIMTDYYLVCKGKINLPDLYHSRDDGTYWYFHGINLRAVVGYLAGLAPNFAGFLVNMKAIKGSTPLTHSYYFAWITSTVASGGVYFLLTHFFPQKNAVKGGRFLQEMTEDEIEDVYFPESKSSASSVDEEKKDGVKATVVPAI